LFPIDISLLTRYVGRVRVLVSRRSIVAVICVIALLGPLSRSTQSAAALIRLTVTGDVSDFRWSPRGDAVYFTRDSFAVPISPSLQETGGDLYRVSSAGGSAQLLVRNASYPAPAPDGNQVAFLSLQSDGYARLGLLNISSRATANLAAVDWGAPPQWTRAGDQLIYEAQAHAATVNPTTVRKSLLLSESVPFHFQASPSGDSLAFVGSDGVHVVSRTRDVNVFRVDGASRLSTQIEWSRAGTRLAFVVTRSGFEPELWVVDANGANATQLLKGGLEYFAGLEWAPDDSDIILTRTPTGSSVVGASEIWRVALTGLIARALTKDHEEESSPKYSPDGTQIAFLRNRDVWVMQLDSSGLPLATTTNLVSPNSGKENPPPPALPAQSKAPTTQLTPPSTIRVMHDQYNTCRNVPIGRIDAIDFETYVKRVVPAEVYSSWPSEALKSQAVAARSYAWFWVLQHTTQTYDVTDSTAYQYMCDNQYPSTDSAVDATRGQYGNYNGKMIFAAYGANNGDPTQTNNWGNPYLIAVDDPVDFGNGVSGNGIGMSQWGSERWAAPPYRWNYQQILMHYYSGVTIELPAGGAADSIGPIAAMNMPWSNWGVTSNHVFLSADASDNSSTLATVGLIVNYFDGNNEQTVTLIPTYNGTYWNYVADVSSFPDQAGIKVTPKVTDPSGNSFSGNGVNFVLDRSNPTGTVTAPRNSTTQDVTLSLSASDSGPGGLSLMGFSNNWIWQGENQSVTNNSGTIVDDPAALDGKALMGQVGVNPPGYWYGPYTYDLPLNQSYRAYFRLKTDNVKTSDEVALLDVVDNGGSNVLGLKRLRGADFRANNIYQEFYVDLDFSGPVSQGLEFRVAFRGAADLWLDRVIVTSYPVAYSTTAQWTLTPGNGLKTVQAKFTDGVGNVSADAVATVWLGPGATPSSTPTLTPTPTSTRTPTISPTRTPTPVLTPMLFLPLITH
jgi:hypothetical protein